MTNVILPDPDARHRVETNETLGNFMGMLFGDFVSLSDLPAYRADVVHQYLLNMIDETENVYMSVLVLDDYFHRRHLGQYPFSFRMGLISALLVAHLLTSYRSPLFPTAETTENDGLNITCFCPNVRACRLVLRHTYILLQRVLRRYTGVGRLLSFNRNEYISLHPSSEAVNCLTCLPARPEALRGTGSTRPKNLTILFEIGSMNQEIVYDLLESVMSHNDRNNRGLIISDGENSILHNLRFINQRWSTPTFAMFSIREPIPVNQEETTVATLEEGIVAMSLEEDESNPDDDDNDELPPVTIQLRTLDHLIQ
jgi:hypothetical protein